MGFWPGFVRGFHLNLRIAKPEIPVLTLLTFARFFPVTTFVHNLLNSNFLGRPTEIAKTDTLKIEFLGEDFWVFTKLLADC